MRFTNISILAFVAMLFSQAVLINFDRVQYEGHFCEISLDLDMLSK